MKQIADKAYKAHKSGNIKEAKKLYKQLIEEVEREQVLAEDPITSDDISYGIFNYGVLYVEQAEKRSQVESNDRLKDLENSVKLFRLSIQYAETNIERWRDKVWPTQNKIFQSLYAICKLWQAKEDNDGLIKAYEAILDEYKKCFLGDEKTSLVTSITSGKSKEIFDELLGCIDEIYKYADKVLNGNGAIKDAELYYNLLFKYIKFCLQNFTKILEETDKTYLLKLKADAYFNLAVFSEEQRLFSQAKKYVGKSLARMEKLINETTNKKLKKEYEKEQVITEELEEKIVKAMTEEEIEKNLEEEIIDTKETGSDDDVGQQKKMVDTEEKNLDNKAEKQPDISAGNAPSADSRMKLDFILETTETAEQQTKEDLSSNADNESIDLDGLDIDDLDKKLEEVSAHLMAVEKQAAEVKQECIDALFDKLTYLAGIQEKIHSYHKWAPKTPHFLLQQEGWTEDKNFKEKYKSESLGEINNKLAEAASAIEKAAIYEKELAAEKQKKINQIRIQQERLKFQLQDIGEAEQKNKKQKPNAKGDESVLRLHV